MGLDKTQTNIWRGVFLNLVNLQKSAQYIDP